MPNALGEEWSSRRKLYNITTVDRPYSIINDSVPRTRDNGSLSYTITTGENKGEIVESLPTTKLQYMVSLNMAISEDSNETWIYNILNWVLFTLGSDYGTTYVPIELHVYIGSDYAKTNNGDGVLKKWRKLYAHHVWNFRLFVIWTGYDLIIELASGAKTCKAYTSYTSIPNVDSYTEPYNVAGNTPGDLISISGNPVGTTVDLTIDIGDDRGNTSPYTSWFNIEGDFPIDTGMYYSLTVGGSQDSSTIVNKTFATLLELDNPSIFTVYNPNTGLNHLLYKNSKNYVYDRLRVDMNTAAKYTEAGKIEDVVYGREEYSSKNKFMSLIITNDSKNYVLWQDGTTIKIKYFDAADSGEIIVVEGSTNPVGYYNKNTATAYVFFCKDSKIGVIASYDLKSWTDPLIFIDNKTGNIGKQSVGVIENAYGQAYVMYYDSKKAPQIKLFSITELQKEGSV